MVSAVSLTGVCLLGTGREISHGGNAVDIETPTVLDDKLEEVRNGEWTECGEGDPRDEDVIGPWTVTWRPRNWPE